MKIKKIVKKLSRGDVKLIKKNIDLVSKIATQFSKRLPASVNRDDLIGAGSLGLVDSVVRRKRGGNESSFACYTRIRIRGAIYDELRAHDWLPRRSRMETSEKKTGNGEPNPISVMYFDDISYGGVTAHTDPLKDKNPMELLSKKKAADCLKKELELLPERDQLILNLHYFNGMQLKEIGRLWGISEARISQIHHRALAQLKPRVQSAA